MVQNVTRHVSTDILVIVRMYAIARIMKGVTKQMDLAYMDVIMVGEETTVHWNVRKELSDKGAVRHAIA